MEKPPKKRTDNDERISPKFFKAVENGDISTKRGKDDTPTKEGEAFSKKYSTESKEEAEEKNRSSPSPSGS